MSGKSNDTTPKCKVQIYLPFGALAKAPIIKVLPDNTLREILYNIDFKPDYKYVLFTGTPNDSHGTPLVNHDSTMSQINMWFKDATYTAEITVYKEDDTNYDKELYAMYLTQKNEAAVNHVDWGKKDGSNG